MFSLRKRESRKQKKIHKKRRTNKRKSQIQKKCKRGGGSIKSIDFEGLDGIETDYRNSSHKDNILGVNENSIIKEKEKTDNEYEKKCSIITDYNNPDYIEYFIIENNEHLFSFKENKNKKDDNLLGKGGFSTVYICNKKNKTGDICGKYSLKRMKKKGNNEEDIQRELAFLKLIKENKDLRRFALEYFYYCQTYVEYFIFAELLQMSLSTFIEKKDNPLYNVSNVAFICSELIKGIKLFHKYSLFHHDIKPSNIMLNIQENTVSKVKYIDFGLSCDNDKFFCQKAGTYRYWCPLIEQEDSLTNPVDLQKIDRFALGLTIFELINKKHYMDFHDIEFTNGNDIKNFFKFYLLNHYKLYKKYNTYEEDKIISWIKEKENKLKKNEEKLKYIPVDILINYDDFLKEDDKTMMDVGIEKINYFKNKFKELINKYRYKNNNSNTIRLDNPNNNAYENPQNVNEEFGNINTRESRL